MVCIAWREAVLLAVLIVARTASNTSSVSAEVCDTRARSSDVDDLIVSTEAIFGRTSIEAIIEADVCMHVAYSTRAGVVRAAHDVLHAAWIRHRLTIDLRASIAWYDSVGWLRR